VAQDTISSNTTASIVVVLACRLEETHRDLRAQASEDLVTDDERCGDQADEDDEDDEVEDRVADDSSLPELRLLERIDGWSDLSAGTQPEEHDGVKLVAEWDQKSRKQDEKDDMAEQEITSKETKLSDLAKEFTTRLRDGVPAHVVPLASPPSNICVVASEFTS